MTEKKTQEPDNKEKNLDQEMSGMVFRTVKIQFYPEDLKKMETMTHDEKMDFVMRLRAENRYVEVEEDGSREL